MGGDGGVGFGEAEEVIEGREHLRLCSSGSP